MGFRILLTESSSPLGAVLHKRFEQLALAVVCPEPDGVDWADEAAVAGLLEQTQPAIIINTLSWAEQNQALLARANRCLAEVSRTANQTVIHLSSHEVFPAHNQNAPCGESDSPCPETEAGEAFLEAEQAFLAIPRCLVLRLPWLADWPQGLLEQVCSRLVWGDQPLSVSDHWRGSPVMLDDCARALMAIVQQVLCGAENWGVFHFRSSDACSEAEYADYLGRVLRKAGYDAINPLQIVPVAQRLMPTNGWLAGQRCTNNFGIQLRSWRQGVKSWVKHWLEAQDLITVEKSD